VLTTAKWLGRGRAEADRDWFLVCLTAIFLSPLGWRYYYCLAIGPAVGWLQSRPATRPQLLSLLTLMFCPAIDLIGKGSLMAQITIGSLAFWSLLAAWVSVGSDVGRPIPAS
jgi:hypothetical protein